MEIDMAFENLDQEIIDMQMAAILKENPDATVMAISSSAHQGLTEVLRELREMMAEAEPVVEETAEEAAAQTEETPQ